MIAQTIAWAIQSAQIVSCCCSRRRWWSSSARSGAPAAPAARRWCRSTATCCGCCAKKSCSPSNASWLFRVIPYLVFATTWVAAALVPTFALGLAFSWSADLIAIVGLLGTARFFLALAGLDIGTSFGGIGSSREVMIASLAEPALIVVVFTLALIAGSTQLSTVAGIMESAQIGLRVSLALALFSLIIVAIAENARIPVDNPTTHLELTMVHEAMVLEYSGRHLALIEAASALKLLLYVADCLRLAQNRLLSCRTGAHRARHIGKLAGGALLAVFETSIAKMRCSGCRCSSVPR